MRQKLENGDRNIFPVSTASIKKFLIMYYPWGDEKKAEVKAALKWKKYNQTLPWRAEMDKGIMTVYTRDTFHDFVTLLEEKWRLIRKN